MAKQVTSKKEYIIKQISKTNNKDYENYVVTGIIHGIKSLDLEFTTQQFVKSEVGKFYLTDLYFPALKLHIEIDERHHIQNEKSDKLRSTDIVNVTGHDNPLRIICYNNTLVSIDKRIEEVVSIIKKKSIGIEKNDWFCRYSDPEQYYKEKGILNVDDNPTFRIAAQIANLLGQGYKDNAQITWVPNLKEYDEHSMWCPKIHNPHESWTNTFCQTEGEDVLIQQNNKGGGDKKKQFEEQINDKFSNFPRITFPYLKDNLGVYGYKFRGIYELDKKNSSVKRGVIYKRKHTELKLKTKII